jgi:putative glycosyltransferase (TIGR04372 family)
MDIYLTAKCRMFIGSPSGLSAPAEMSFEVPLLIVNYAFVGIKPIVKNALYIPKKIKYSSDNSYASFAKLLNEFTNKDDPALGDGNKFRELGYVYEDNTEDEILDATIEMYEQVTSESKRELSADDKALLNSYFELYPENHFSRKNKTPVALSFLKRNRELYFE